MHLNVKNPAMLMIQDLNWAFSGNFLMFFWGFGQFLHFGLFASADFHFFKLDSSRNLTLGVHANVKKLATPMQRDAFWVFLGRFLMFFLR